MKRMVALVAALGGALPACGLSQLHTARPTPAGELDVTLGAGVLSNEVVASEGGAAQVPLVLNTRFGVAEQADVGARLFLGDGVLVDGQLGLLPRESPWAVSVSAGFGAGGWLHEDRAVSLVLPVVVTGSWDATAWLTPYVGVGGAVWWHVGREVTEGDPDGDYVGREGYGDGVVTLLAGVSVRLSTRVKVVLEYDFMTQVWDDPGDLFSMVDSHVGSLGVTF